MEMVEPDGKILSTSVIISFPFLHTLVSPISTPGPTPGLTDSPQNILTPSSCDDAVSVCVIFILTTSSSSFRDCGDSYLTLMSGMSRSGTWTKSAAIVKSLVEVNQAIL